ncbi:MAG TPA: hypothetical protein VI321_10845, partial [Burkholderiales bacterium]
GSAANFQNLATGLVQGTPIILSGVTADGLLQTVTITPSRAMTATQAAQTLEATRQLLISRGIAQPSAQQIGVALTGGALPTPLGTFQTPGTLTGTINTAALQVQQQPALATSLAGSAANLQNLRGGLTQGGAISLSSATGQTVTFSAPGGAMTPLEANQTLQLASQLLVSQGITNPTPEQIRAALLGGTVATPFGTNVRIRGVLEGRGSPASPTFTTSNPTFTTSNPTFTGTNPTFTTSNPSLTGTNPAFISGTPGIAPSATPGFATAPGAFPGTATGSATGSSTGASAPNGAPSPAAQMQGRR